MCMCLRACMCVCARACMFICMCVSAIDLRALMHIYRCSLFLEGVCVRGAPPDYHDIANLCVFECEEEGE